MNEGTNFQIEAQVTVTSVTKVSDGTVRIAGNLRTEASALYGGEAFDVELEWRLFGPVATKVHQGGAMTAFAVAAAAHTEGPVQDAITGAL